MEYTKAVNLNLSELKEMQIALKHLLKIDPLAREEVIKGLLKRLSNAQKSLHLMR